MRIMTLYPTTFGPGSATDFALQEEFLLFCYDYLRKVVYHKVKEKAVVCCMCV